MTSSGNWGTCPKCKQYIQLDSDGDLKPHRIYSLIDDAWSDCPYQGEPE